MKVGFYNVGTSNFLFQNKERPTLRAFLTNLHEQGKPGYLIHSRTNLTNVSEGSLQVTS